MYVFGKTSKERLETCHQTLQSICHTALDMSPYDFGIVRGWSNKQVQNALFESGASQTPWPRSKHNHTDSAGKPQSLAIDFAVYIEGGKLSWDETHIYACVAGIFFAAAKQHQIKIRWGGDWDGDGNTKEHTLQDWGHIELVI